MVLIASALFLPFLAAALMPALYLLIGRRLGIVGLAVSLASLAMIWISPEGSGGTIAWAPQLGIDLALQIDGWGRLLALLITGIGSLIMLYSIMYLGPTEDLGKFYSYILLFMGAMLGVSLSANLMLLYVFWELTSVSSFLLIGFWYTRESGVYGALKSVIITVGGGLTMLAGIVIVGYVAGTYEIAGIIAARDTLLTHPLGSVALVLLLIGAFTKSAQVPFHIWLPDAMAAPTPVSAYLHSATMVKAGLFLVARLWPIFAGHALWTPIVATVGLATMFLGGLLALQKTDLKAVLALSTVSQLGLIMALFGFGTQEAAIAGVFHLFNHSTFKGLLFMVAGIIDHETGTRDIARLSGLRKAMPVTAVLAIIGAASMAGIPPLNGFLSKELFLEASLHSSFGLIGALIATGASVLTTIYCLVLAHKVFFGPESHDTPKHPHEAPWLMLLPPAILAALVVGIGVFPAMVEDSIIRPAVGVVTGASPEFHLHLWHGWTPGLMMSGIAIGGGLLAYAFRPFVVAALKGLTLERLHANALYDWLWWREQKVEKFAKWVTDVQMTGVLRDYLVYILGTATVAILGTFWIKGIGLGSINVTVVDPHEMVLMITVMVGAITAVFARARIAAVASIGLIGMPISLYFALMRAPDLAMTQLVIELITGVLFLLIFAFLPQLKTYPRTPMTGDVNLLVSVGVGVMAGLATLLSNGHRLFPHTISNWYIENSHKLAGGDNVVNVTIVDFRGFDTMGEITVLTVTGLAMYMLIRRRKGAQR